jgi:hypothetical protein
MKLTIKAKADKTIQRNLRLPIAMNNKMNELTRFADELGADYHGSLLALIEQFNIEFEAKLHEMKTQGQEATGSDTAAGRESIPDPVSQQHRTRPSSNTHSGITSVSPAPSSNDADTDRA